ncbi:MAG: hypothetical protein GF418_00610 [Chitinivibrionales bacterium]|nr:hypothetical protein [Chitinivibrionales bacterium]
MRPRFAAPALAILALQCAAPLEHFYPDTYFPADGVYQNKSLRFSLTFRGGWRLTTDPRDMRGASRNFARELQERHAELLFAGTTVEGNQGVRGIAANLNIPYNEYADRIREINREDVHEDLGITETIIDGIPMVRWDYTVSGFRFVEFFFVLDTYNVRIAFWTRPAIFERFESVYLDIMSSLDFISRY